jgi:ribose transport system permease protein
MSPSFQQFLTASTGGVTLVPVAIMLVVALLGMLVLAATVLGRQVYAIGGNEVAAKYAGIPVGRVKIIVYTLMGMAAGLAGFVYVGYYGAAEPNAGTGYELSVIAAAVIGGASLSGGRGSPVGAVLGAILVQLIDNSLVILDIDQSYKQIVIGGAIVAAVVLDQAKARLLPGVK